MAWRPQQTSWALQRGWLPGARAGPSPPMKPPPDPGEGWALLPPGSPPGTNSSPRWDGSAATHRVAFGKVRDLHEPQFPGPCLLGW